MKKNQEFALVGIDDRVGIVKRAKNLLRKVFRMEVKSMSRKYIKDQIWEKSIFETPTKKGDGLDYAAG